MSRFARRLQQLSHSQLITLACALQDEVLQLRPDEPGFTAAVHDYLCTTAWFPTERADVRDLSAGAGILLICDSNSCAEPLLAAARGERITVSRLQFDIASGAAQIERALAPLENAKSSFGTILYCPGALAHDPASMLNAWTTAVRLSIALIRMQLPAGTRLWFITPYSQSWPEWPVSIHPGQAALNALGKTLSLEAPDLWGGCIDLDEHPDSYQQALREIASPQDDEVAFRSGRRYVPALQPVHPSCLTAEPAIEHEGAYLVTGGTGGIGQKLIGHLLERGATTVFSISRHDEQSWRAHPDRHSQELQRLEHWRTTYPRSQIHLLQADLAQPDSIATAWEAIRARRVSLRGIFHTGGINEPVALRELCVDQFQRIIRPKLFGAWHLDVLTRGIELDFQLYFSSIAATLGTASMAPYAMANRFLDAFSQHRNQRGQRTLSVAWGPWADVGMIVKQNRAAFASLGLNLLAPQEGLRILDHLLRSSLQQVMAMDADWQQYSRLMTHERHLRPLHHLVQPPQAPAHTLEQPPTQDVGDLGTPERSRIVLRTLVSDLLGAPLPEDSDDRPLQELGMTSLLGVELARNIQQRLQIPCRPTLLFDFPTLGGLAAEIAERWRTTRPQTAGPSRPAAAAVSSERTGDIAIVAMACRLPGADSPAILWEALLADPRNSTDHIQQAPAHRFDLERYLSPDAAAPGKTYTLAGGYLDDVAAFDHNLFHLSRSEANWMDPQQRLALETSWQALHTYRRGAGPGRPADGADGTGVYFGVGQSEYGALCRSRLTHDQASLMATGQSLNIIAGRIAYLQGFQGPAVTFDTACSSSLVALEAAVRALRDNEIPLAVVGGVNALITPDTFVLLAKAGALSRRGRCAAFDASADGYVRSEGCVVLILKRLSDARRDGDPIHAVIRGIALNHDGRSNGLTAPSGAAQERLLRAALRDARLEPRDISLIEAHGTGTPLGDPIEYQALRAVYGDDPTRTRPLHLGTVKSLIGHTEAAAGLAGVLKLVLSLNALRWPAQRHFKQLNPYIDACPSMLIPASPVTLHEAETRYGAVSAFGFSGTNAHAILERGTAAELPVEHPWPFKRVRCWYTSLNVPESAGLAQAFGAARVRATEVQVADAKGANDPAAAASLSLYAREWQPYIGSPSDTGLMPTCVRVLETAVPGLLSASYSLLRRALMARQDLQVVAAGAQEGAAKQQYVERIFLCIDFQHPRLQESRPELALELARKQYEGLFQSLHALLTVEAAAHVVVLTGPLGFEGAPDPVCASLLETFTQEHPALTTTLIERDANCPPEAFSDHLDTLLTTREPVMALSRTGLNVPRLQRLPPLESAGLQLSPGGTFLVSGGLGGVGRVLTEWLLTRGARSVVILNRRLPTPDQSTHLADLAARYGAAVEVQQADVTDLDATAQAVSNVTLRGRTISGVVHCAGVNEDGPFERQTWDRVKGMVGTKFVGAWHLHIATLQQPVRHFVLCSSVSALLGSFHQAGYCFANSLMDRLAGHRRALGRPALSIQLGPWSDVGMASRGAPKLISRYRHLGLSMLPPRDYLQALSNMLQADADNRMPAQVGLFELNWGRYERAQDRAALYTYRCSAPPGGKDFSQTDLLQSLTRRPADRRSAHLQQALRQMVADCLELPDARSIDEHRGFAELGITSLHTAILHRRLERALGSPLQSTLIFDHPSVVRLARYLMQEPLRSLFSSGSPPDTGAQIDTLTRFDETQLLELLRHEVSRAGS